jgi:CBS domain-containing protein
MQVREIMTVNPVCCGPDINLQEVARLMLENDCGEIPVVHGSDKRPIGVITDRDITCRAIAQGKNPLQTKVRDCMSTPALTVTPEMSLDECCRIMEEKQIRRIPVVDEFGSCCGIVAQADIALQAPDRQAAEVVKDISRPA